MKTLDDTSSSAITHRLRRAGAASALAVLVALVGSSIVFRPEDVTSDAALTAYLDRIGTRMFVAWLLVMFAGLAWLAFVAAMYRMLHSGMAKTLFLAAAVAGQAAAWLGASLAAVAAAPSTRGLTLPVYHAFATAGVHASACGAASIGAGLVALAVAGRRQRVVPGPVLGLTAAAGLVLVLFSTAGPVVLPVWLLWLLVVGLSLLLTRRPTAAPAVTRA